MFERRNYYSESDVLTYFDISIIEYRKLLEEKGIVPIQQKVDLGGYSVTNWYIPREVIDALDLPRRKGKG